MTRFSGVRSAFGLGVGLWVSMVLPAFGQRGPLDRQLDEQFLTVLTVAQEFEEKVRWLQAPGSRAWVQWWEASRPAWVDVPDLGRPALREDAGQVRRVTVALSGLLGHEDPQVRAAALFSLGRAGVAGPLVEHTTAEEPRVRAAAWAGLGMAGTREAAAFLVANRPVDPVDAAMRMTALGLLPALTPTLDQTVASAVRQGIESPGSEAEQRAACWAAAVIPLEDAAPLLRNVLEASDSFQVVERAVWGLAVHGDEDDLFQVGRVIEHFGEAKRAPAYLRYGAGRRSDQLDVGLSITEREALVHAYRTAATLGLMHRSDSLHAYDRAGRRGSSAEENRTYRFLRDVLQTEALEDDAPEVSVTRSAFEKIFQQYRPGFRLRMAPTIFDERHVALIVPQDNLSSQAYDFFANAGASLFNRITVVDARLEDQLSFPRLTRGPALLTLGWLGDRRDLALQIDALDGDRVTIALQPRVFELPNGQQRVVVHPSRLGAMLKKELRPRSYAAIGMGLMLRQWRETSTGQTAAGEPAVPRRNGVLEGDARGIVLRMKSVLEQDLESDQVRAACAMGLGLGGTPEAAAALRDAWREVHPQELYVRGHLALSRAMCLETRDDAREVAREAFEVLTAMQDEPELMELTRLNVAARAYVQALSLMATDEVDDVIAGAWGISPGVDLAVAEALGERRVPGAIDLCLGSIQRGERAGVAALALGDVIDPPSDSRLMRLRRAYNPVAAGVRIEGLITGDYPLIEAESWTMPYLMYRMNGAEAYFAPDANRPPR